MSRLAMSIGMARLVLRHDPGFVACARCGGPLSLGNGYAAEVEPGVVEFTHSAACERKAMAP